MRHITLTHEQAGTLVNPVDGIADAGRSQSAGGSFQFEGLYRSTGEPDNACYDTQNCTFLKRARSKPFIPHVLRRKAFKDRVRISKLDTVNAWAVEN